MKRSKILLFCALLLLLCCSLFFAGEVEASAGKTIRLTFVCKDGTVHGPGYRDFYAPTELGLSDFSTEVIVEPWQFARVTIPGYSKIYWSSDPYGRQPVGDYEELRKHTTFYAHGIPNTANIQVDLNGGTWSLGTSFTSNTNRTLGQVFDEERPTKLGYRFEKWEVSDSKHYTEAHSGSKIYGDMSLKAKWTTENITYHFSAGEGELSSGNSVISVGRWERIPEGNVPVATLAGKSFRHWKHVKGVPSYYINSVWNNDTYYEREITDVYLEAVFSEPSITLTYYNDSEIFTTVYLNEHNNWLPNESILTPEREGYKFTGWVDWNGERSERYLKDTSLFATWVPDSININLNPDGGRFAPNISPYIYAGFDNYYQNGEYEVPLPEPTKNGYKFAYWYDADEGDDNWNRYAGEYTEYFWHRMEEPKRVINLRAKWAKPTVRLDFVSWDGTKQSYYLPGGADIDNLAIPAGKNQVGRIFVDWQYIDSKGEGRTLSGGERFFEDTTFKASYVPAKYTVNFVAGQGLSNPPSIVMEAGEVFGNRLPQVSKEGKTFLGWFVYNEGNHTQTYYADSYLKGNGIEKTGQITLHARWADETVTIKFYDDPDDLSLFREFTVSTATLFDLNEYKPAITKAGYEFAHWNFYTGNMREELYHHKGYILKNTEFYAVWNPLETTLHFDSDGGTAVPSVTLTRETAKNYLLQFPEKSGYKFFGWSFQTSDFSTILDRVYSVQEYFYEMEEYTDVVLKARYIPESINIEFRLAGGQLDEGSLIHHNLIPPKT